MSEFVPVNTPRLDGNEAKYLLDCVESGWISSAGAYVRRFEEELAARIGRRHAIAVCNGTAALQLAVDALELGSGDEVIVPSFTIISCASAVVRAGATPVFVDVDPVAFTLDLAQVEEAITERTRAIMPVHIYGLTADMTGLEQIAERHGLHIIEDAAEAIGSTCDGRPCGSFGAVSTFSMFANKHVTAGEGGAVVTDDDALAERLFSLRNLCFVPERRFVHYELGWNYRITNMQAAVAVAQLERLDAFIQFKRRQARRYAEAFAGLEGVQLPADRLGRCENDYWVYGLVLGDERPDADKVAEALGQRGIGTRPFFYPMHLQPALKGRSRSVRPSLPVAERIARKGLYIPSGLGLDDAGQDRTIEAVLEVLA